MKPFIKVISVFLCLIFVSCQLSKIDDEVPPSVFILSPADDSTVSQIVTINCLASDNEKISFLELYIDLNSTGKKDKSFPYSFEWYTNSQEVGIIHSIAVRAYDNSGNYKDSDTINVIVDNSNWIRNEIELNQIIYTNNNFFISWPVNMDYDFVSYSLYESFESDMLSENLIYTTNSRTDTAFNVSGIALNELRYYRLKVAYLNNINSLSQICSASSYPKIIFTSYREGSNDIYSMDIDGSNQTKLTTNVTAAIKANCRKDGSKIVYVNQTNGWEIWTMNSNGKNQKRLTPVGNNYTDPKFSPDGSKIVFHNTYSSNANIYIINSDGSGLHQLTFNLSYSFSWKAEFMPDGNSLIFPSQINYNSDVYSMGIDGSNITNLTQDTLTAEYVCISPGGHKIAYVSIDYPQNEEIYIMNSNGSNKVNLTNSQEIDRNPIFSPDGNTIYYIYGEYNQEKIYAINIDGTNKRQITFGNRDVSPLFLPDGSKIVFLSKYGSHLDICIMNPDGTNIENLTHTNSEEWDIAVLPVQ